MIRKVVYINQEKCNGCGLCMNACHEGAIGMVGAKARLLRDDYCDGLGDCLPACPTGAITCTVREAAAYDAAAVRENKAQEGACPGNRPMTSSPPTKATCSGSELRQWPVQIKLAPISAPFYGGAHLLIAADCAAYAYAHFHTDFMKNCVTLIGCPKLDDVDYADKLRAIIARNDIGLVTVVRMEVPCCGGLELAVKQALQESSKLISCLVVTITTDGRTLEEKR